MPSTLHPKVGVGLRTPHVDYFKDTAPELSWLEIHSENYFSSNSQLRNDLRSLRDNYDISCHGIGLSLGSVSPVNEAHLTKLKALIDEIDPILISDHLSWSESGGHYFNDLLPLPYTEEALQVFCRNVLSVQDFLRQPILIENPSSYLSFTHSTIDEWEFLNEVQKRTECHLLLDFNNIHVSSFNHGFDCNTYLDSIDSNSVKEVHLAGFTKKKTDKGEIWIDTHSRPVSDEVWALFSEWSSRHDARHTLIEWDLDIPEPNILLAEARKASDCLLTSEALKRRAS
jgi:uncharacterized protein (UPF0276 family)